MSLKHVKTIKAQKTQEEPVTIPTNPSNNVGDLPGGTVGKNLLANAGDMGSITDLGGSQMPRSNETRVTRPLSPCSRAWEPQLLSPCAASTEARVSVEPVLCKKEKLQQREARALQAEKAHTATKTPCSQK